MILMMMPPLALRLPVPCQLRVAKSAEIGEMAHSPRHLHARTAGLLVKPRHEQAKLGACQRYNPSPVSSLPIRAVFDGFFMGYALQMCLKASVKTLDPSVGLVAIATQ